MNRPKALALFYRMLAELLGAGVPVTAALAQAGALLPGADRLADRIEQGDTVAQALDSAPWLFPANHRRLIAVGEKSGRIEQVLGQLAEYAEDVARLRSRVLAGLALPACLLHLAAVFGPLPALVMGGTLDAYLVSAGTQLAVLWLVATGIVMFARGLSDAARDAIMRRLPWFSGWWRELDLWWLASGMELLVNAGVPTIAATRECANNCRSPALAAQLRAAAEVAEAHGAPVGSLLAPSLELPAEVLSHWRTGERSGYLERGFAIVARDYRDRVERRAQVLAAWAPRVAYALVIVLPLVRALGSALQRMNGFGA